LTEQFIKFPRFYLTVPSECPYLPDRFEQKIFTELKEGHATELNNSLSKIGFRRSQKVAYKPACENCNACLSVRINVNEFKPSRTMRRVLRNNNDLITTDYPSTATHEQYDLLSQYLNSRHAEGGMAGMSREDYSTMVEETPIDTRVIEFRKPSENGDREPLIGACLTDMLDDGLSMIYSFYDPKLSERSFGTQMILHHIDWAQRLGLPFVYLGYWIEESEKMSYKARFQPLEAYENDAWRPLRQKNAR
jgi:arginyl-tRNA--protein-N-Asp/Glu arginylyltransferase